MNIQAEVDENGIIKISGPNLWGKKVTLTISEENGNDLLFNAENEEWSDPSQLVKGADKTDWEAIKKFVKDMDKLDFPRRTHEEIIRDLHELRG